MTQPTSSRLMAARFRANPRYEIHPFERLSPTDQRALATLCDEAQFYGLLRPNNGAALRTKSLDCDTALLLYTLQQAGPLPNYLLRDMDNNIESQILSLVMDGLLEVDSAEGFCSGPQALALLDHIPPTGSNAAARLANQALQMAQALTPCDPSVLTNWLYSFNQIPVAPRWRRLFVDQSHVASFLGIQGNGPNARRLADQWRGVPPPEENNVWFMWYRREPVPRSTNEASYKLYISPHPAELRAAFDEVVAHLANSPHPYAFKIGNDVQGLLRPDKLVLYFRSREALDASAEALAQRLDGFAAQGVPFTAPIDENVMLSWGIDPPQHAQHTFSAGRESWRYWVATKLAVALHDAWQANIPTVEPWHFALERLRLEGIDVDQWQPSLDLLAHMTPQENPQ